MRLALIGCGRMGTLVEQVAADHGHRVVARFTRGAPLPGGAAGRQALAGAEAGIDFSVADAVPATAAAAAELGLPLVVGTTDWHESRAAVAETFRAAGGTLVWGANFSLGVQLFYRVVARAAADFARFAAYDPFVEEAHHKGKRDRPSGTARELLRLLASAYGEREIAVTSLRAGHFPGVHAVGFDAEGDTVRLEHRSRNRRGYAEGALLAAGWATGRHGVFTFADLLDDLFPPEAPAAAS